MHSWASKTKLYKKKLKILGRPEIHFGLKSNQTQKKNELCIYLCVYITPTHWSTLFFQKTLRICSKRFKSSLAEFLNSLFLSPCHFNSTASYLYCKHYMSPSYMTDEVFRSIRDMYIFIRDVTVELKCHEQRGSRHRDKLSLLNNTFWENIKLNSQVETFRTNKEN